jgi:Mrp family chromosome partitioning ATPase
LLTAFESLPAMSDEAAALARPAELSPSLPPSPAEPSRSAAAAPREEASRSALDKLSARWPISDPLPTSRASTPTVAPSEPAAEVHVEVPVEVPAKLPVELPAKLPVEPTPLAAAQVAHPEPAAQPIVAPVAEIEPIVEEPVAEITPVADETAADEPIAEQPAAEQPVAHEPTAWVDHEPAPAKQPHDERPSHSHTPPPLAPPTAPLTLVERTTRRTLSDPQRAEPYRQVAERIVRDLAHVAGRSAVLTGVGPASETSELVLVAAAALENAGGPVLVIDGDTAHRSLTTQLELSDARGLAELLRERHEPTRYIRRLSVSGLSFLPIGKTRFPEPEPVASQLAALVQSLEAEYSLVLIDGGRTSELAAATLARLADATYFVIRLGHTEASVAQNALRDFRAAGARVLGCVATS